VANTTAHEPTTSVQPQAFDVAIIGCGPTGALLANLLGQAGLSVAVLEREAGPTRLPRAIHYDGEVARILQFAGLADEMAKVSRPAAAGTRFMNPAGQTLMVRPGFEEPGPHGWPANAYIHQPNLEAVLRRGLERFPSVQLLSLHEVTDVEPVKDGALVSAQDNASGAPWACLAKYVVGCDGARSLVRRRMGAQMEDLGLHQPWLVVDVLVDPESDRARTMPEYSIQFCDPSRPMSVIYVEGNRRRWEIMIMPGDEPERMTEPDRFWPMISRWIGPEDAKVERSAVYTFHALIAYTWRQGPLLLAGDSCHQTPPFLGQGMCAGMRDAANLAWKLGWVIKGEANPALLDTYETERRPHVAAFIQLAVELGAVIQTTDLVLAAERDARMASGEPVTIHIPSPALGPGAWIPGGPANGSIFPQPRLQDGRRLDEATQGRIAIVGAAALLERADEPTRRLWRTLDVALVPAEGPELAATLAATGALAVILRPDSYVFGTAIDTKELADLSRRLPATLRLPIRQAVEKTGS
jgi:3-(3-hydroxy-phenyl)propionate hydroxylase